ncbi:MAG: VapC toxin family PIN domain ribonuclease [Desulfobacteraceae bacterium CG2_30_51_40]|nr:MAG: VapC toxin family PIN domain ribonuclease [Desulfobacteraceae bacterium CG2_30_51_40]
MRLAHDTNILAYAEGVGDAERCAGAIKLVEDLPAEAVLLPARDAIMSWADSFEVADSSWSSFQSTIDLAIDHGLQIWDALIMAVAAENHCRLLLSEDLQNGFTWRGLTVVNPFAPESSRWLDLTGLLWC